MGLLKSHYELYNGGTQNPLSTILWGYPKAIKYYFMAILKSHYLLIMVTPKSQYLLHNGGTQQPLSTT